VLQLVDKLATFYSLVCPLIMVAFLGTFLNTSKDLGSFLKALGIIRSLRWVSYFGYYTVKRRTYVLANIP
jgi:hypothetical protein